MNSSCSLTFLWFAGREESNFDNKRLAKFGELRKQNLDKTWNSSPSKLVSVLCSSEAVVRMLDNFCMKRIAYKLQRLLLLFFFSFIDLSLLINNSIYQHDL